MQIIPRDNQTEAVDSVFTFWHSKPGQRPLVVMPTGAGKTIVFSMLVKRLLTEYPNLKVLVLAHRKELIEQSEMKIKAVWPDAPVGVYAAGLKRREFEQITVASRDSIAPVLEKSAYSVDLVILDEAHNLPPNQDSRYQKIFSTLQQRNEHLMVLGFTATPYRAGSGIIYGNGQLFDEIAYEIKLKTLFDQDYLCMPRIPSVDEKAKIDTTNVPIISGEFSQKKLAVACVVKDMITAQVKEWYQLAWSKGRKYTMFYCVSRVHAYTVAETLHRIGFDAPVITGETLPDKRQLFYKMFNRGEIPVAINIGVFTEGTDLPRMDCLVCLRAINSLGLWMQIIGRGLRISPHTGKNDLLLLDYGSNTERFGPIDIAQPPPPRRGNAAPRTKECPECGEIVGFYKQKCLPPCDHTFQQPVHKKCPECEEPCAPSAMSCPACGTPFVNNSITASDGTIINGDNRWQWLEVHNITTEALKSARTGREYLKVVYHTDHLTQQIKRVLPFGYEGAAGERAIHEWHRMTRDDIDLPTPATAEQAHRICIDWQNRHWRPVRRVMIDLNSQYRNIISIHYQSETDPVPA